MRWLIGIGLLAVTGLLFWAWWLPTLLVLIAATGLFVCLDWPHCKAIWDGEMYVSPDYRPTVNEWRNKAADWDTLMALQRGSMETQRRKVQFLKQIGRY